MGATVSVAVLRQDSLDLPAPSMSRGIGVEHHRRWAAYALSLGFSEISSAEGNKGTYCFAIM